MATPAEPRDVFNANKLSGKVPTEHGITDQRVTALCSKFSPALKRDDDPSCVNYQESQFFRSAHQRAARMVEYALTLGTPESWDALTFVLAARLTAEERAALAFSAMMAVEPAAQAIPTAAVLRPAGVPLPAFIGGLSDARWWASRATREELIAFGLACFDAMTTRDRAQFIRQVASDGRAAR